MQRQQEEVGLVVLEGSARLCGVGVLWVGRSGVGGLLEAVGKGWLGERLVVSSLPVVDGVSMVSPLFLHVVVARDSFEFVSTASLSSLFAGSSREWFDVVSNWE